MDLSSDPDAALMVAIAAGDQRAFADLVRRHGGRLRAVCLRFLGNAADAEEIVQETFWTIWRTAERYEPRGARVSTYLHRIALNRCIDRDRRRRIRRLVGLEEAAEIEDPTVDQETDLAVRTRLAAVRLDIAALPARQRAALLLAVESEKPTAEIATVLGVSVGAAEQLLVRARRTLREKLARREPDPEGTP
ncbi:RNA polymerase sigma factor [Segnochrobactraceae bacterium EtOH-i3]